MRPKVFIGYKDIRQLILKFLSQSAAALANHCILSGS